MMLERSPCADTNDWTQDSLVTVHFDVSSTRMSTGDEPKALVVVLLETAPVHAV